MSQIRQAALQKPGKPNTIPNLRPIAVMSAWWRLYESAWVQSDSFVAWRHKIGRGHNVAYIESSEQVAATVNKAWRDPDGGYVAAMDFSKAFDHMAPELSKQAMIAAGWPENIATLMADVWKAQKRTVCFGGHQDPVSLRTTHAHPQGGPLGPTVCQLWLLGGAEWTAEQRHSRHNSVTASEEKANAATEPAQRKRRKPNDKREVDAVYMDDRSLVRGDARVTGGKRQGLAGMVGRCSDAGKLEQVADDGKDRSAAGAAQGCKLRKQADHSGQSMSQKRQRSWAQR